MMSDIGEIVYLPRLIQKLQREAPGVRLSVRRLSRPRVQEDLASGAVDLALGWLERTGDLRRDDLFREDFVCIVRPDHPRIRRRLTLKQFTSEWHLAVGRQDLGADAAAKAYDGTPDAGLAKSDARPQDRDAGAALPGGAENIISHTDLHGRGAAPARPRPMRRYGARSGPSRFRAGRGRALSRYVAGLAPALRSSTPAGKIYGCAGC